MIASQRGPRPGVGCNSFVRVFFKASRFTGKEEEEEEEYSNGSRQQGTVLKHLDTHNVGRGMTSSHTTTAGTTFLFALRQVPALACVLLHVSCVRPTLFGI
jgi:hypothetical protein